MFTVSICPIADDVHFQSFDRVGVCRVSPIYSYSFSLKINKNFIEGTLKPRTFYILHQTFSVQLSILFTDNNPHCYYYFDTQIAWDLGFQNPFKVASMSFW